MTGEDIIKLVPTLQATGLAGYNFGFVKKKKKKLKDFIDIGTTNLIGTSLIKSEGEFLDW